MESTTLLLPLPFGPTMAVMPFGNWIFASANDLKPSISNDFRYTGDLQSKTVEMGRIVRNKTKIFYHSDRINAKKNT